MNWSTNGSFYGSERYMKGTILIHRAVDCSAYTGLWTKESCGAIELSNIELIMDTCWFMEDIKTAPSLRDCR